MSVQADLFEEFAAIAAQATDPMVAELMGTGQRILDARQPYLDVGKTLAWLYDPATMPADLREAHRLNDAAVDRAYGYAGDGSDADRAAFLFKLYARLTGQARPRARKSTPPKGATP